MEQGKINFGNINFMKDMKKKNNTELNNILQEYSLKQSNFDPKKPSPNVFIKKLEIRMKMYYKDLYKSYN
uniref:Uncharacterized protein n=1 Tax=viral metagenome TaxID=1070528 RepID=A0A6C0F909_9ZZZZ|tara:strand:- start:3705 stop:3914 length:210 start_codon:yes stop_codon:yes gene_type:complete